MDRKISLSFVARCFGFSLVELLMVMAVMVILLLLLIPGLSRAREHARRAVCMSNAHQIGLGITYYLQDNDDKFPPTRSFPGLPSAKSLWGKEGELCNAPPKERLVNRYVGMVANIDPVKVTKDPSDKGSPGVSSPTHYQAWGTSYSYNSLLHGFKSNHISWPEEIVLLGCDPMYLWEGYSRIPTYPEFERGDYLYWHDKNTPTANINFVDGHVNYTYMEYAITNQKIRFVPY